MTRRPGNTKAPPQRSALITITLPSEKLLQTMLEALVPETRKPGTSRAKVSVVGEGKILTIRVQARDTSALRATLNSYLRWVALVRETIGTLTTLEETKA